MSSQQYVDPKTGGALGQVLATGPTNVAPAQVQMLCDTASGVVGVQLPLPAADGTVILISDNSSNAATNNITITPTGGLLIDGAATLVLSTDDADAMLVGEAATGWTRVLPPKDLPFSPTRGIRNWYYRAQDASEVVPPTTPGGSPTELQYNNAGAFGGTTGIDFDSVQGGILFTTGKFVGVVAALSDTLPAIGAIRSVNNKTIFAWKNAGGTDDISGLVVDVNDRLYVGTDAALTAGKQAVLGFYWAGNTLYLGTGTSLRVQVDSTAAGFAVPKTGGTVSPWGDDGMGSQAMADANQTPAASVYQYGVVTTTGALTASRTLSMVAKGAASEYYKAFWNQCTGANLQVTIQDTSGGGTTFGIPSGCTALGMIGAAGAKQLTPLVDANGKVPYVGVTADPTINGLRLTLTTGVPVTTSDVTAAGTLFFCPFISGAIALYDGTQWILRTTAQVSLSLTLTSGKNYDVFASWSGTAVALSLSNAWTNDTTRADALATQDGVIVLSSDHTKRFLGTIRASGANVTEDSVSKRFVSNWQNAVKRNLRVVDTTNSWTYTNPNQTWRQANSAAANTVGVLNCDASRDLDAQVACTGSVNTNTASNLSVGIGIDSTTVNSAVVNPGTMSGEVSAGSGLSFAFYKGYPGLGFHAINWLETGQSNTQVYTFYGDNNGTTSQSGLSAWCVN